MSYFLNSHVLIGDKNKTISQGHYESNYLEPIFSNMIFVKVYCNMGNYKIENVDVEYDLTFYNSKKS